MCSPTAVRALRRVVDLEINLTGDAVAANSLMSSEAIAGTRLIVFAATAMNEVR
jgi:hypothetical protein